MNSYDCINNHLLYTGVEHAIKDQVRNFSCETAMLDRLKREYQYLALLFKEKYFTVVELSYLHEMYSCLHPAETIYMQESLYYMEYKIFLRSTSQGIHSQRYLLQLMLSGNTFQGRIYGGVRWVRITPFLLTHFTY